MRLGGEQKLAPCPVKLGAWDAGVHLLVGVLEQVVDVVVVDFDASDKDGEDVVLVDVDQLAIWVIQSLGVRPGSTIRRSIANSVCFESLDFSLKAITDPWRSEMTVQWGHYIASLSLQHGLSLGLDLERVHFVRFEDVLLALLEGDAVEDGVEAAREHTKVLLAAGHRVGLARAGHSVGEQGAILAGQQLLDKRQSDLFKDVFLLRVLVEYLSERVDVLREKKGQS